MMHDYSATLPKTTGWVKAATRIRRGPMTDTVEPQDRRLLRRQMLADDVYEAIKTMLMDHVIRPGARISIDGLAREFQVSSTPVREALARLESEGLAVKEPLKGYRATPLLSLEEFDDLYRFRLLLEPWAARRAAELIDDDGRDRLRAELATAVEPTSVDYAGYKSLTVHDNRFHLLIAALSGSEQVRLGVRAYPLPPAHLPPALRPRHRPRGPHRTPHPGRGHHLRRPRRRRVRHDPPHRELHEPPPPQNLRVTRRPFPLAIPPVLPPYILDFHWDVELLHRLDLPTAELPLPTWPTTWTCRSGGTTRPFQVTPRQVAADPGSAIDEQYARTLAADLRHPLDVVRRPDGRITILDGVHRLLRAELEGREVVGVRVLAWEDLDAIAVRR